VGSVFISYRREDSQGQARALFQDLVARLGRGAVFMDVDSIALGHDFREVLQQRLASCDLMLVLIGPDWLAGKDAAGRRRLDNPGDFVRLEVSAGLKRKIAITPLLVQGAAMPTAEQLPEDIADLAFRNGFELSHNRWDSDVQELVKRLALTPVGGQTPDRGADAASAGAASSTRWLAPAGIVLVLLALVGGGLFYRGKGAAEKPKEGDPPAIAATTQSAVAAPAERAQPQERTHSFGGVAGSRLTIATPDSYRSTPFTIAGLELDKDFRIEFQIQSNRSGGSTRYGIAWNFVPDDFLLFTLHSVNGGSFSIGPGKSLNRPPFSRFAQGGVDIHGESGWDTLRMTKSGAVLAFAINGQDVWQTTELRLTSADFAFWVADFSDASIRSFTLRQ
jgi:TIR domain